MGDDGENDYAPDVLLVPSRLKHFSKVCLTVRRAPFLLID